MPTDKNIQHPTMLSVEQALSQIKATVPLITIHEKVALRQSLGRVLAQDIISTVNVPPHRNSAMDGYAIRSQDLPIEGTQTLTVIGRALAGQTFTGTISSGQCVRIMTGAVLPIDTDTVIMQEQVTCEGDHITFKAGQQMGQHVRGIGEDLAIGQTVLKSGQLLLPPQLGLIASLGIPEISVWRKLRVAFFSTGDELRSVGQSLQEGDIYDSNRYTLYGMLARLGVDIIDMGVIRDEPEAIREALLTASKHSDVILTTGGVSVGEADYIKEILASLGQVHFWKISIKPGKPLAYGKINQAIFFGLPGNPVAVMVTFYQFVQPALQQMMGYSVLSNQWKARSLTQIKKKPGRTEFLRGILTQQTDSEWFVQPTQQQGSHILRSMSEGNCFIILRTEQGNVAVGDWVEVQPFAGMM